MTTTRLVPFGIATVLLIISAVPAVGRSIDVAATATRVEVSTVAPERQDRQRDRDDEAQEERFTRTLTLAAGGELELSNVAGNIVVRGGSGRDVVLEVTKRARRRRDAAEQLAAVEVEIEERGNRIEVRTNYRRGTRRSRVSVHYDVRVPRNVRVSARSVSGDITVSDVDGETRAETVSGDVEMRQVRELTLAKTVSGDLDIRAISTDRELTMSSVSGDVTARDLTARRLSLQTVSGDLELEGMRFERIEIDSVSGDIEYEGELDRDGRYTFNTHSGDVRLTVSDEVGFELEASSFSGSVRSDLPVILGGTNTGRGRRGRRTQSVSGTFGDGSAQLEISTFSGDVVITTR